MAVMPLGKSSKISYTHSVAEEISEILQWWDVEAYGRAPIGIVMTGYVFFETVLAIW